MIFHEFMMADEKNESDGGIAQYDRLIDRQPFTPKTCAAVKALPSKHEGSEKFRFTGFMSSGKNILVGIENLSTRKSYLLMPGILEENLLIKEIQIEQKFVMLLAGGETMRLDLMDGLPRVAAASTANIPSSFIIPVASQPSAVVSVNSTDTQSVIPIQRRIRFTVRRPRDS